MVVETRPRIVIEDFPVLPKETPTGKVLRKAREWLSNKYNWTQGVAKDDKGRTCAIGAVAMMAAKELTSVSAPVHLLDVAAQIIYEGRHYNIISVNDLFGYEATLQCFDLAIKLEKGEA